MGTKLTVSRDPRVWIQELDGHISRREHSTLHLKIADHRSAGTLKAIIVDARDIRDNPPLSLLREIWNDGLEVLAEMPVAYLPPPGHTQELEDLLMTYVREWDINFRQFSERDAAFDWCVAQLDRS